VPGRRPPRANKSARLGGHRGRRPQRRRARRRTQAPRPSLTYRHPIGTPKRRRTRSGCQEPTRSRWRGGDPTRVTPPQGDRLKSTRRRWIEAGIQLHWQAERVELCLPGVPSDGHGRAVQNADLDRHRPEANHRRTGSADLERTQLAARRSDITASVDPVNIGGRSTGGACTDMMRGIGGPARDHGVDEQVRSPLPLRRWVRALSLGRSAAGEGQGHSTAARSERSLGDR